MALTGDYSEGMFYVNGVAGGAFGTGDSQRNVSLPGLAATASGRPGNSQALGAVEAGYTMAHGDNISLTPFASMNVGSVNQHAFSETGAGTLNLTVAAQTITAAQSVLGTRTPAPTWRWAARCSTPISSWAGAIEFLATARRIIQSLCRQPQLYRRRRQPAGRQRRGWRGRGGHAGR